MGIQRVRQAPIFKHHSVKQRWRENREDKRGNLETWENRVRILENWMKKKWKARKIDKEKVMKMARLKKRSERTRKKH